MDPQSNLPKLLALAAKGDRHSFGEFYALHLNEIYRYILFRVNNHDDAEDLTAKVFFDAWHSLTRARRETKVTYFRAWIYRIARNKVIDYHRNRRLDEPLEANPDQGLQSASLETELDDLFLSRELVKGLRRLPANYQEVIILRFINQMSHAEVAEIMDIAENHVRVLQYRALKQMRRMLSEVKHE